MATPSCPICGKPIDPAGSEAMPFCSQRCKQVDLGRWLGERYRVPAPLDPEEAEDPDLPPPSQGPPEDA